LSNITSWRNKCPFLCVPMCWMEFLSTSSLPSFRYCIHVQLSFLSVNTSLHRCTWLKIQGRVALIFTKIPWGGQMLLKQNLKGVHLCFILILQILYTSFLICPGGTMSYPPLPLAPPPLCASLISLHPVFSFRRTFNN
jgi:hypothetical protein